MAEPNKRISELTNTAIKLSEIDHNIPFKRYLRASKEIIRTADYYLQDHQLESAFILYSKYCTLFVEKFPKHPEYKAPTANEKKIYSVKLQDAFKKAESLKQKLLKLYQLEYEKEKKKQACRPADVERSQSGAVAGGEGGGVVDDAQRYEEERLRREEDDMRALEERFQAMKSQVAADSMHTDAFSHATPHVPSNPPSAPSPPPSPLASHSPHTPAFDRALKPSIATSPHKPFDAAGLADVTPTSVDGLRNVIIPCDLAGAFLNAAKRNSDKNIETCGILLGSLFKNKWKVYRVLVPQQIGGSDTCDITNDEEMVAYQDEHNLITLGWIHTHPSQTAFLSSVDQHTQWPYQKFFPEAVAVVCSPKYKETGYFNLSDEGMHFLKECKGQGFHQHPINPPLFQSCKHVEFDASYNVVLQDLRR